MWQFIGRLAARVALYALEHPDTVKKVVAEVQLAKKS
jgi:hypothetical protein